MSLLFPPTCLWTREQYDEAWRAACDADRTRLYVFTNDDGPTANGFEFCPYCGKPLDESVVSPSPDPSASRSPDDEDDAE